VDVGKLQIEGLELREEGIVSIEGLRVRIINGDEMGML
jgi:hypothetical protein